MALIFFTLLVGAVLALLCITLIHCFFRAKRGRAEAWYLSLCFFAPLSLAVLFVSLVGQSFWLTALLPAAACGLLFLILRMRFTR